MTSKFATSAGDDISCVFPTTTIIGVTLHNMPLKSDTRVPLEPMALRRWAFTKVRLRDKDEEEAKSGKGVTLGTQRR